MQFSEIPSIYSKSKEKEARLSTKYQGNKTKKTNSNLSSTKLD